MDSEEGLIIEKCLKASVLEQYSLYYCSQSAEARAGGKPIFFPTEHFVGKIPFWNFSIEISDFAQEILNSCFVMMFENGSFSFQSLKTIF